MKRRPLLINASRGGLVNEEDLVRALDEARSRARLRLPDRRAAGRDHPLWQSSSGRT